MTPQDIHEVHHPISALHALAWLGFGLSLFVVAAGVLIMVAAYFGWRRNVKEGKE